MQVECSLQGLCCVWIQVSSTSGAFLASANGFHFPPLTNNFHLCSQLKRGHVVYTQWPVARDHDSQVLYSNKHARVKRIMRNNAVTTA